MSIKRQNWRNQLLSSISELTCLKTQEKEWLNNKNTNPHWSFVEFNCSYFDDILAGLDYQVYLDKGYLNKSEFDCIKDWHNELDAYSSPNNDDHDHLAILKDPKWLSIVKLGKESKNKLLNIVENIKEKELLNEKVA